MKRNSLTTAVVAGIAGIAGFAGLANAVNLNPDGVGQVLLYPYYTVNKGQDTLISVVNTDTEYGKAVKVRFLEGYNSREVLDFNLYLSAADVWTAWISDDGSNGAAINTIDTSCIDYLPSLPWSFSTGGFDGTGIGASGPIPKDSGPKTKDRTREGYLEMILMGDIDPATPLGRAITHKQNGNPDGGKPSCAAPVGDDVVIPTQLLPPTSGLFGGTWIANVANGTAFSYNADAIEGFSYLVNYTGPSSLFPTLQDARTNPVGLTPALMGIARAYVFGDDGSLIMSDYGTGEDAVSAVFMSDTVYNEYMINAAIGGQSDWVVTFPTKRFYVDNALYPGHVTSPFAEKFGATADDQSRVAITLSTFDHEEGSTDTVIPRCPSPPDASCFAQSPFLPYEVNVISFTKTSPPGESTVFGSKLYRTVDPFGDTGGWAALDLQSGDGGHILPRGTNPNSSNATQFYGLPATGFWAAVAQRGSASANYNGVWRHRAHRTCNDVDTGGIPLNPCS